jgi:RNA polymerase sigma-70 factor, ECF subfamily
MTMRVAVATSGPAPTEASLIERARDMDAGAWDELYTAHHPAIFRYLYVRTRDANVASELAADVFVQAVQGIQRYRYKGVAFRAWLFRIARNLVADHHRKRKQATTKSLNEEVSECVSQGNFADDLVDRRTLLTTLGKLTPEQQEVVALRFFEGLSLAEVAEATGRRTGAVKALQHRALQRMRTILEKEI